MFEFISFIGINSSVCQYVVYGFNIVREIMKSIFEISRTVLNPYTANMHFTDFYFCVIFDIFELWRHKP